MGISGRFLARTKLCVSQKNIILKDLIGQSGDQLAAFVGELNPRLDGPHCGVGLEKVENREGRGESRGIRGGFGAEVVACGRRIDTWVFIAEDTERPRSSQSRLAAVGVTKFQAQKRGRRAD